MILFHAKRDGTVTTTPNFVPQGSSMQDLVVVSEFDYACCAIRLLPASGEYIEDVPCNFILQRDLSTIFTAALPPKATVVAGSVDYQLVFTAADGTTQTTLVGSFTVPRGVPVSTPPTVGELSAKTVADLYSILDNIFSLFAGHEGDIVKNNENIADLIKFKSSAGTVTIPMSEWTDAAPTMASVKVSGVDAGSIILMLPADEKTRMTANNAKLSAYPVAFTPVGGDSDVLIFRAEAETIPDSDMTFTYLVLKTGITDKSPIAAIVGVDAYGDGGGGSGGGGSVDPEIVNQVLVAASAAQTSAENAATSAEAANTAKSAAETAAERAEAAAERAESAGGAGGGGESEYTGSLVIEWKDSRLGMGNTNGDYFTNGAQIDVYPANERTYQLASEIGLYVYMVADHTSNDVIIFGLNDGAEIPDETMTFNFNVTDMGTDDLPVATLHLEWSGSGGGSADEATINAKIYEHNTANDSHQDIRLMIEEQEEAVDTKIAGHNTANDSHQDIRLMIKEHEEAVNALLNSDDETLNETKEIVAYIKSNKSLIDTITTSKVNVSDIINNLTTNVTNKPLSAAQGVALNALIDGLQNGKLNATDLTSAINTALAQAKASGEFDGKDGKSAYELAQENGYKGSLADFFTDMKGEDGKSAYAYAKDGGYAGTEEEFAEDINPDNIKAELSQIETPKIVSSVAEMIDTTKHYVLNGNIYYNKTVVTEGETIRTYPNQFVPSTAQLNKRLSGSSGSTSTSNGYFITDFIAVPNYANLTPYNVRLNWELPSSAYADDVKVMFYNSSKTKIGYTPIADTGHEVPNAVIADGKTTINPKIQLKTDAGPVEGEVAYIRLQLSVNSYLTALTSADIANLEITLDAVYTETTTESTTKQEWVNSGISYSPTFKTDLVGVLGEGNVIYLSDNLPSGTYTLKYGDETYTTIGTITVE